MNIHNIDYLNKYKLILYLICIYKLLFETSIVNALEESQINRYDLSINFVFSIIKHSATVPKLGFNKEFPYNDMLESKWEGKSYNQITDLGIRQSYILGLRFRERYLKLINSIHVANEILFKSTDTDRTKISLQSFVQGFINKGSFLNKKQEYNPFLPYGISNTTMNFIKNKLQNNTTSGNSAVGQHFTPIVPFYIIYKKDKIFNPEESCSSFPKYDKESNELVNSVVDKFMTESKVLNLNQIKSMFNIEYYSSHPSRYRSLIKSVAKTYISNYINDNSNNIIDKYIKSKEDARAFYFECLQFILNDHAYGTYGDYNKIKSKFKLSRFLDNLINIFDSKIKNIGINDNQLTDKFNYKFYIISSHNPNIISLLVFLRYSLNSLDLSKYNPTKNKHNDNIPFKFIYYSSFINIELLYNNKHSNSKERWFVNIVFNDDNVLLLPYNVFKLNISKNLMSESEIKAYCGSNDLHNKTAIVGFVSAIVVLFIIIVLFVIVFVITCRKFEKELKLNNKLLLQIKEEL